MNARVLVRLKDGILDAPGASVRRSLNALGFREVVDLRIGKVIDLALDTDDPQRARQRLEEMCKRLLANPVIERCTIEIATEAATAAPLARLEDAGVE
jgi:phosphoribosylformylglycinamidine synthase PurS subunit